MDDAELGRQLSELAALHRAGALTDHELEAARLALLREAERSPELAMPGGPPRPHRAPAPPTMINPPVPPWSGPAPPSRSRPWLIPLVVAGLVVAAALGGLVAVRSGLGPQSSPGPAATKDTGLPSAEPAASPRVVGATASCESPPSKDAAGVPVSYGADNVDDGNPSTAWRCDGSGVGQQIELRFAGPSRLSRIGIVPGYAKTDPSDGTDRYLQNRRLASVRYEFEGGSLTVNLDTDPGTRQPQYTDLTAVTSYVRIVIQDSVPGGQSGTQPPVEKVAVSEVTVS